MREVVSRRFSHHNREEWGTPDILLIDGGKGQLNAAVEAFRSQGIEPPSLISLAKQEEEIFRPGESESIKLSRTFGGAPAVAIRPRRGASICAALSPSSCARSGCETPIDSAVRINQPQSTNYISKAFPSHGAKWTIAPRS